MKAPTSSLAELFPEGDYRFHLTLRRGEPADFFRRRDSSGSILAERRRWLAAEAERHAAIMPEGAPLLTEFFALAAAWSKQWGAPLEISPSVPPTIESVVALGAALEPDFLLMAPDARGAFRLVVGAVAFPSGWALEEKMGRPLDFIHGVVPGLNAALAPSIQQFLSRLKPGAAFLRSNWGLAATHELNLHPARRLPPPGLPARLDRLWLRVEDQALAALPNTGGVLFGIRIERYRLDEATVRGAVAAGLRRALESMPEPMAAYKGLADVRGPLIELLKKI